MMKKNICRVAVEHFGTTEDIYEAGYIMPDGKMLDFSQGKPHFRSYEHADVNLAWEEDEERDIDKARKNRYMFMDECHAIRVSVYEKGAWETGCFHAHTIHKPTEKQLRVLAKTTRDNDCVKLEKHEPRDIERFKDGSGEWCFIDTYKDGIINPTATFIKRCFK